MLKIAWSAGHGLNTPGKRSPEDEREWTFNSQVVMAAMSYLSEYKDIQQLRLDDPSGKSDIPLIDRTDRANSWNADIYISCHHNALQGTWGNHSGIETYVFSLENRDSISLKLAKVIHPFVVQAMGIADRGIKTANFHELRETRMPAILFEGGFMDSRIDIRKMRDNRFLRAQGEGMAKGIVNFFDLKLVDSESVEGVRYLKPSTNTLKNELVERLQWAMDEGILTDPKWVLLAQENKLSIDDAVCLLATIDNRSRQ